MALQGARPCELTPSKARVAADSVRTCADHSVSERGIADSVPEHRQTMAQTHVTRSLLQIGDICGATAVAKTILEADPWHMTACRVAATATVQTEQLLQLLQASSALPGAIVPSATLEAVMQTHREQRLHAGVALVVASQRPASTVEGSAVQLVDRSAGVVAGGEEPVLQGGRWQNECLDNVLSGWSAEERLIIKLDELTWLALASQVRPHLMGLLLTCLCFPLWPQ